MVVAVTAVALLVACQPVMPVESGAAEPEIFVQGAAIPGVMDIDVGPDGNLYAAAELADALIAVDPDTGEVVWRFDTGEDVPEAMRVAPDGTPYWTSFYSVNICRVAEEGEKRCQALPVDTWGLAFAPDGRLFASADAHVQSLYEVDPMLEQEPRFVEAMGGMMAHFNFGPDGKLYVPMVGDGTILRIDVDTEPVTVETIAEGLVFPWSVAFDPEGQLYVAISIDGEHSGVARVDMDTGETELVGQVPPGYNTVAVTEDGRILTALYDFGAAYEILPDGSSQPITEPGIIAPGGLGVMTQPDGSETLYVADWKTLCAFDTATGEQLSGWHSTWFPGSIVSPRSLAVDGDTILVSSWYDQWSGNAIQIWDPAQEAATVTETEFEWPANAIRFQGDVVLVDMKAEGPWTVERTSGDAFAERHELGAGFLQQPLGLAASAGDLWVTDYETGRVVQLIADGEELAEPIVVADGLDRPEGIALAPDGRLLVVETGTGRLLAIEPASGAMDVIAEGLGIAADNFSSIGPVKLPPHLVFNGVAVGQSGNVYVSGDAANAIYRIPLP